MIRHRAPHVFGAGRPAAFALAALCLLAVVPSVASAGYRDEVLVDDPAAYWRLGETSGTNAASEVAGNTGTYAGGVTLGEPGALGGDPNPSITLDGVNDAVVAPDSATLDATTGVTVELWAKRTRNAAWQVVLGKPGDGQSRNENYAIWFDTSNRLQAYFGNGTTFVSVAWGTAVDNGWHHIAATYDNATARLYVDGVQRAQTTSSVPLTPNALPLNIGRANSGAYPFQGALDEVAVYRTALPAARIQAHFAAAAEPPGGDSVPPVVSVGQPAAGATVTTATPAIAGTAGTVVGDLADVTVRIYAGSATSGTPIQTLTATRASDGSFTTTPAALANGTHTVTASQADAAGNVGVSPPVTFTVAVGPGDAIPPNVSLTQPATGSVSSDATPTFSGVGGTASGDSDLVTVRIYSGAVATGTPIQTLVATRGADGAYSVTAAALADGTYTASAAQADDAGNTGLSTPTTVTIDTLAPNPTVTQPGAGATTDATPTIAGVAGTAGGDASSVSVRIYAGSAATGTPVQTLAATRQSGGAYGVAATALTSGAYTAQTTQTDTAGNTGQSAAVTFTVDATAPVVSLNQPAPGATLTTAAAGFAGVAGTASGDSATVSIAIYAGPSATGTPVQTVNTTGQAGGAYTATSTALANGTYTARATQADSIGNIGQSAAATFTIAVAGGGSDPVLIGAGDIAGCGSTPRDDATAALLAAHPAATVFTAGDNAYDNGTAADYANCYDPTWGAHKSRTRPTIGDHDLDTGTPQAYLNYFSAQLAPFGPTANDATKMYYSYNLGSWHVVHLNAVCFYYTPGCNVAAQEAWLRADLAANANLCTAVIMSSPRFSSGNVHSDNTDMQGYWAAAYEGGAELVISGDDHIYERFAPMDATGAADPAYGLRQFVVGTGGYLMYDIGTVKPNSQVRYTTTFGVIKLTLHPTSYDWEFLPIDGLPSPDSGTTSCHGTPPPPGTVEGAPTVRSTATGTANYASTSVTIPKPAGTAAGDVLLATIGHQGGTSATLSAPAGWTAVPGADASDGTNARIRAFSRVATAAEPASYTFTLNRGMSLAGGITAITGANTAAPINAAGARATTSSSRSIVAPSITTTVPKTRLFYAAAVNSPQTYAPPGGMAEQWDVTTSGRYNVASTTASAGQVAAGATGTRTATTSQNARGAALLIAIAPAVT